MKYRDYHYIVNEYLKNDKKVLRNIKFGILLAVFLLTTVMIIIFNINNIFSHSVNNHITMTNVSSQLQNPESKDFMLGYQILDNKQKYELQNINHANGLVITTRDYLWSEGCTFDNSPCLFSYNAKERYGKNHPYVLPMNVTTYLYGVDTNYGLYLYSDFTELNNRYGLSSPFIAGRDLLPNETGKIIIGEWALPKMTVQDYQNIIGKKIEFHLGINYNYTFEIVGIIREETLFLSQRDETNTLFISLTDWNRINNEVILRNQSMLKAMISIDDYENADEALIEMTRLNGNTESDYKYLKMTNDVMELISFIFVIIGAIVLLSSIFSIIFIMTALIKDRRKFYSIMLAIGYKQREINLLFILEIAYIYLIQGIIGIIISILASLGISQYFNHLSSKLSFSLLPFYIPFQIILLSIIFCLSVGLISGIIPCRKISRISLIQCLKEEE